MPEPNKLKFDVAQARKSYEQVIRLLGEELETYGCMKEHTVLQLQMIGIHLLVCIALEERKDD